MSDNNKRSPVYFKVSEDLKAELKRWLKKAGQKLNAVGERFFQQLVELEPGEPWVLVRDSAHREGEMPDSVARETGDKNAERLDDVEAEVRDLKEISERALRVSTDTLDALNRLRERLEQRAEKAQSDEVTQLKEQVGLLTSQVKALLDDK